MGFRKKIRQAFWIERGLGMLPNERDDRDYLYRVNNNALDRVSGDISLEQYSTVVDQGSTSSCVGNAVAGAVWIKENQSGKGYLYPSRNWLYWNARYRHQGVNVTDDGTFIRECCKALCKVGVPDEKLWPFKKSRINNRPEFGLFMKADPRKGGAYYAITQSGDARITAIRSALAEGHPVVFGTRLVESFMSAKGSSIIEKPKDGEDSVGRHAMVIIGHKEEGLFRVLNSWGKYWRDEGKCWFTDEYIAWGGTRDLTIIKGWKRLES